MKQIIFIIALLLCIDASHGAPNSNPGESKDNGSVAASVEHSSKRPSPLPQSLPLDEVDRLENRIDKRLSDVWGTVSVLGYIGSLLGILITIVVLFFSIRSTKTAVAEAKIEARKYLEEWLKADGNRILQDEIEKVISPHLSKALQEIKDKSTPVLLQLDDQLKKTEQLGDTLEKLSTQTKQGEKDDDVLEAQNSNTPETEIVNSTQNGTTFNEPPPATVTISQTKAPQDIAILRRERPAEAISILEQKIEELENATAEREIAQRIDLRFELARCFAALGDREKARELFLAASEDRFDTTSSKVAIALGKGVTSALSFLEQDLHLEEIYNLSAQYIDLAARLQLTGISRSRALSCLVLRARCQYQDAKYEAVLETYEQFKAGFRSQSGAPGTSQETHLEIRKARALLQMNRSQEAKTHLEGILSAIEATSERVDRFARDRIRLLLGDIFRGEKHFSQALAYYRLTIESGDAPTSRKLEALLQKAAILSELQLRTEEIDTYDKIIATWQRGNPESYAFYGSAAMVNKAIALSETGHTKEALDLIGEVNRIFGDTRDPDVAPQITKAGRLRMLLER